MQLQTWVREGVRRYFKLNLRGQSDLAINPQITFGTWIQTPQDCQVRFTIAMYNVMDRRGRVQKTFYHEVNNLFRLCARTVALNPFRTDDVKFEKRNFTMTAHFLENNNYTKVHNASLKSMM